MHRFMGGIIMNEEIIKNLKSWDTYYKTFNALSEEEKEKYFIYSNSLYYISRFLGTKDDRFIVNFINNTDLNIFSDTAILEILENLKNKNLLLNIIDMLPNRII